MTASVNDQTMGKIETDVVNYYKGDKAILTVTANQGYELEKLVIGETEVTEGWTKEGLVYTYELTLAGDTTVVTHLKATAVPKVTPNVTVTGAKYGSTETPTIAENTQITLTNLDAGYTFTGTVDEDGKLTFTEQVFVAEYKVSATGYFDGTVTITEDTTNPIALTLYVETVDCEITVGQTGADAKFVAEGATLTFKKGDVTKTVTVENGKVKLTDVLTGSWVTTADFGGYELHLGWTDIGTSGTTSITVDASGIMWSKAEQPIASSNIAGGTVEIITNKTYHNKITLASTKQGGAMAFKFALPETPTGNFKSVMSMPIGLGSDSMYVVLFAEKNGETKTLKLGYTNVNGGEWWNDGDRLDLSAQWDTFVGDGLWIVVDLNKDTKAITTYAGATLGAVVNQNYDRTFKGSSTTITGFEIGNAIDGNANTNLLVTFKYGASVEELKAGNTTPDPTPVPEA